MGYKFRWNMKRNTDPNDAMVLRSKEDLSVNFVFPSGQEARTD